MWNVATRFQFTGTWYLMYSPTSNNLPEFNRLKCKVSFKSRGVQKQS
uniref:Uncharacterized protein n=1 Tax=Anguilla anguilla TaxID=7936 RepID=A0A0E9Q7T3_ANGAN